MQRGDLDAMRTSFERTGGSGSIPDELLRWAPAPNLWAGLFCVDSDVAVTYALDMPLPNMYGDVSGSNTIRLRSVDE